jgi:hypothetical protein
VPRWKNIIGGKDEFFVSLNTEHLERAEWHNVAQSKRQNQTPNEPKAWWQHVIAGERLPNHLFRYPKCAGTIEDHREIALDVRELIRKDVFEQPVGSTFRLNIAFPWLRVMRLNANSLHLELITGRTRSRPSGRRDAVGHRAPDVEDGPQRWRPISALTAAMIASPWPRWSHLRYPRLLSHS